MNYTISLLCEIIESELGTLALVDAGAVDGCSFRTYRGKKGLVFIDFDNDDLLTDATGISYLLLLGLDYLIANLYPTAAIGSNNTEISNDNCPKCAGVGSIADVDEGYVSCDMCNGTGKLQDVSARLN